MTEGGGRAWQEGGVEQRVDYAQGEGESTREGGREEEQGSVNGIFYARDS